LLAQKLRPFLRPLMRGVSAIKLKDNRDRMSGIPEQDWKRLRALKDKKLNEICADILSEINHEIKNKEDQNHKAYLKVWEIVDKRDDDIADMFNDLRRSNAVFKLALWKKKGYLSDKELNEFTESTRSTIEAICQ
jgi:hypothetical protein